MISNFDTKTIWVSSSSAMLSLSDTLPRFIIRPMPAGEGDGVRNEEKGKGSEERVGKLQRDRYARGSEDETRGRDEDSEGDVEKERERGRRRTDRRSKIRYLNSKQTL